MQECNNASVKGSGYHCASLAHQWPGYEFYPTDKNVNVLREGLKFFDGIASLPPNLLQPRHLTTEVFCRCDSDDSLGLREFDVVVANRVGDPFSKPFYIEPMLHGAQLHLKNGGVVVAGYWPLERERWHSAVIREFLDSIHGTVRGTAGGAFPTHQGGRAAAELSTISNEAARRFGMELELVVHAVVGTPKDSTSMCVFRKTSQASNSLHIFPWHRGTHIVIQVCPHGKRWVELRPSAL